MLRLTQTTDKIQVVLGGSVTVNQLQCFATWKDFTATTCIEGRNTPQTNNNTDVDLVPAPSTDHSLEVDYLSVYNSDTVNATVTVKFDANGTERILHKAILGTGEMLQYNDKAGWSTVTIAGAIKQSQMLWANNAGVNVLNTVILSGDVINNNAVANTIADVTGLSFPVTAGETYWFEFTIPYTSAATTTGSRWSITGPSFSMLHCRSEYTLAATTTTLNSIAAYNMPAACNASSLITGNVATIWGIIKASDTGNVVARFASEIANSAITAKAGATLRWMRVI